VSVVSGGKEHQVTVKIGDLHEAMERLAASLQERLGAQVGPLPPEDAERYQLQPNEGVVIKSVQPDGVLGKAGFEEGDIILEINGQPVTGVDSYVAVVESLKPSQRAVWFVLDHRTGQSGYIRVAME
jgi:serine protease Do